MRGIREAISQRQRRIATISAPDRLVSVQLGRGILVGKKAIGVFGNIRVVTDVLTANPNNEPHLFHNCSRIPKPSRIRLDSKSICIPIWPSKISPKTLHHLILGSLQASDSIKRPPISVYPRSLLGEGRVTWEGRLPGRVFQLPT